MAKYLTKWFKQGFISAHDLKSQSMGWGRHGNRSQSQLLHCIPSREAERWILVLSIHLGPQPCCHISFRPLCSSPLVSLWLLILMPFCSSLGWEARAVLRSGGSLARCWTLWHRHCTSHPLAPLFCSQCSGLLETQSTPSPFSSLSAMLQMATLCPTGLQVVQEKNPVQNIS